MDFTTVGEYKIFGSHDLLKNFLPINIIAE
jgi:hypothetical protein